MTGYPEGEIYQKWKSGVKDWAKVRSCEGDLLDKGRAAATAAGASEQVKRKKMLKKTDTYSFTLRKILTVHTSSGQVVKRFVLS